MQQGRFQEAANRLLAREDEVELDPVPLSRATELSTLAYCLSQTGNPDRALKLLESVFSDAATMAGLSAGDYCIELACRSLRACGQVEEAKSRAAQHTLARNSVLPRPFAPFFLELASSAGLARD